MSIALHMLKNGLLQCIKSTNLCSNKQDSTYLEIDSHILNGYEKTIGGFSFVSKMQSSAME